jgi:hypothetical protein
MCTENLNSELSYFIIDYLIERDFFQFGLKWIIKLRILHLEFANIQLILITRD